MKPDLAVGTSAEVGSVNGRQAAGASRYGGAVDDVPERFEKGELNAFVNRTDP
jgi:hypothetical protein